MAKDFGSISAFVGKECVVNMVKKGTEEITGTVKSVKDGVVSLVQVSRGSTYTYRIPASEIVYAKASEETELAKGVDVSIEISINKLVKLKGVVIGADSNGIILDRGEVRGSLVKTFISYSKIDSLDYREATAEGAARAAKQAKRMKEARSGKSEKSEKASKKEGKKLKLKKGKK